MPIYSGRLVRNDEILTFLIKANDPDEVCNVIPKWLSMIGYDITFICITERIDEHWNEEDVYMIESEQSLGAWGRIGNIL